MAVFLLLLLVILAAARVANPIELTDLFVRDCIGNNCVRGMLI